MIRLYYELCEGEPLLTGVEGGKGDFIEYSIKERENAHLRIGKCSVKIKNGVGRVNFSELSHGKHTPILTDACSAFSLDAISVFGGEAELFSDRSEMILTNKRLVGLAKRLAAAEEKLSELSEAVYRKIF